MKYNLLDSVSTIEDFNFSASTNGVQKAQAFNIVYGVDKNYELGVAISITSVLANNDRNFHFHIFIDDVSCDYREKISVLAQKYHTRITLYLLDIDIFLQLPETKVWTHAMYFRLLGLEYLSKDSTLALYLDADIVCKGSLDELINLDMKGNIAAVVQDILSLEARFTLEQRTIFPNGIKYFNSGVILVDLEQWHSNHITKIAMQMLSDTDIKNKIKYPDQDVLNILLHDKVMFISKKYNTIFSIKSELTDKSHIQYRNIITDDTVFIHYTGITKPWHAWACYPSTVFFDNAYKLSPWSGSQKKKAYSVGEYKKKYKHELRQGKYIRGLLTGMLYNILKIKMRISKHDRKI